MSTHETSPRAGVRFATPPRKRTLYPDDFVPEAGLQPNGKEQAPAVPYTLSGTLGGSSFFCYNIRRGNIYMLLYGSTRRLTNPTAQMRAAWHVLSLGCACPRPSRDLRRISPHLTGASLRGRVCVLLPCRGPPPPRTAHSPRPPPRQRVMGGRHERAA